MDAAFQPDSALSSVKVDPVRMAPYDSSNVLLHRDVINLEQRLDFSENSSISKREIRSDTEHVVNADSGTQKRASLQEKESVRIVDKSTFRAGEFVVHRFISSRRGVTCINVIRCGGYTGRR